VLDSGCTNHKIRERRMFTSFEKNVTMFRRSDGSFVIKGVLRGKLYLVDFIPEEGQHGLVVA
jgi:hypothetical protein